jgi:hypothetical protein
VTIAGGGGSGLTVKRKLLELVWSTVSVTVIVYSVSSLSSVGVPPMVPLAVLNVNPADSAGDIAYTNGATPPLPETGTNAVKDLFSSRILETTNLVVVNTG